MIRNYIDFNNAKEKCRDCSIGLCYNKVVLGDGLPIFLLGILPNLLKDIIFTLILFSDSLIC